MAPMPLNPDARCRSVLPRPDLLISEGKKPRLNKRLGGSQSGSRTSFDKSRSLSPASNQTKIPQPSHYTN
jgi:hypothetical protein